MSSLPPRPIKPINPTADLLKVKTERNGIGIIKTIILLLLAFIQIAFLISSYLYFMQYARWFWTLSFILSMATCLYVLSSEKNSQSKSIWIIFLIICFSFGYIVYFISDDRVFWNKHRKNYNQILKDSYKYQQEQTNLLITNPHVISDCNYLKSSGNFITYTNTDTTYFPNGTKMLDSIMEDIKKANKFIFLEFFIISDGIVLNRMITLLEEKIKQGVDVRIIYDDLGSLGSLSRKTKKRIRKTGIKFIPFNKILSRVSVFLNFRDHRKIVVIDGKVAYTGGVTTSWLLERCWNQT